MARKDEIKVGDKVIILKKAEAVALVQKKLKALKDGNNIRVFNEILQIVESDYEDDRMLKNKAGTMFTVTGAYNMNRPIGGEEYCLKPELAFHVYGACVRKVSAYVVDLV